MMALTSQMFDLRYTVRPVYPISTYASGDIHGNLDVLDALVLQIEPSYTPATPWFFSVTTLIVVRTRKDVFSGSSG
jgi:hypothetical protein